MTQTPAQLGARALRKLGVAIVADAQRPSAGPTYTAEQTAARVVRDLGIVTAETDRPDVLPAVGLTELGARVQRAVGGNAVLGIVPSDTVAVSDIAARALRMVGVNPADLVLPNIPAAYYSKTDLGRATLLKLAVIAPDETPADVDQAEAEARVLDVHERLAALGYVTWTYEAVPASAAEQYIIMAANMLAPYFGKAPNLDAYGVAQDMLRQQALTGRVAQIRAEAKVGVVHSALVADGLADWTSNNIPSAVAEDYAAMAAALLAPEHGKQATGYAEAEARVRRVALSGSRGQALAEAKVQAVHDALNAQGLVAWPISAVPAAHAEDYVTLAATQMMPVMAVRSPQDRAADLADREAVEARLRRAGMVRGAQSRALERVQQTYDELNAMGLVSFPITAIPGSMADAMAGMAASLMGEDAGKSADGSALQAGYQRIRQIAMGGPAGQALAEQKVRAVHASLDAQGRVRWTLYDLPVAAEEPYVLMAASLLAPEVGVRADPNWWTMGEMDLMRIVSIPAYERTVVGSYF